jgi:SAM-dependent methyltransferase
MATMTTAPGAATLTDEQLDAIKIKQQATWASGDFAVIGTTLQLTGELLCEAVGVEAGLQVLDVGAGNGNAALAAARRNAVVTAADYVPALLEGAAARAAASGLRLTTREADAEALPFPDASFDAVLSVFGVMFVPRPERAASELVRVCRSRGRIGLVSWTPGSFVGDMFRTIARHVPPPPMPSVFAWGDEEEVERLLGPAVELTSVRRREFVFHYLSARDFVDTFRTYYGPTRRAFAALDATGQQALDDELLALAESANRSAAGSLAVPSEYLEVVASRA